MYMPMMHMYVYMYKTGSHDLRSSQSMLFGAFIYLSTTHSVTYTIEMLSPNCQGWKPKSV